MREKDKNDEVLWRMAEERQREENLRKGIAVLIATVVLFGGLAVFCFWMYKEINP